jgi:hypothetical protein
MFDRKRFVEFPFDLFDERCALLEIKVLRRDTTIYSHFMGRNRPDMQLINRFHLPGVVWLSPSIILFHKFLGVKSSQSEGDPGNQGYTGQPVLNGVFESIPIISIGMMGEEFLVELHPDFYYWIGPKSVSGQWHQFDPRTMLGRVSYYKPHVQRHIATDV